MESLKLHVGDTAPNFTAPDQAGQPHTLSDYLGKWVLLYFYPKDDTPGCTKEACSIRDLYGSMEQVDLVVLGMSADSQASHVKFATKYHLPFTLLSDPDKKIIDLYGAYGKKNMFGRMFAGILRQSYLINPDGKIAKIYKKVVPEKHADQVLKDLEKLAVP